MLPLTSLPPRPPLHSAPRRAATVCQAGEEMRPDTDLQAARQRAMTRYGAIPNVNVQVVEVPGSSKPVVVLRNQASHGTPGVQVHFHGDQYLDAKVGYDQHIGPTIAAAWKSHPDMIFVIPEASNENAGPRVDWGDVSNVGQMTRGALQAAGVDPDKIGEKILSGHSAGGSPVARAIASNPPAPGFEVKDFDRIELYDAAVGSSLNPVSDGERTRIKSYAADHQKQLIYVPGVITDSASLQYIGPSRRTKPETDHFAALWDSLGQERNPATRRR